MQISWNKVSVYIFQKEYNPHMIGLANEQSHCSIVLEHQCSHCDIMYKCSIDIFTACLKATCKYYDKIEWYLFSLGSEKIKIPINIVNK